MSDAVSELTEEERAEKVADALTELGISASAQDTGGGMICVVLEREGGGEITWGTADVTWGAAIIDEDGELISSIDTQWPSDSQDVAGTAKAIMEASIRNGAVRAQV
jgi:hypothetical protein